MGRLRQFTFKQFGYFDFDGDLPQQLSQQDFSAFIKIVFLKRGGKAVIDFKEYQLEQDALFFINKDQYYRFDDSCRAQCSITIVTSIAWRSMIRKLPVTVSCFIMFMKSPLFL